MYLLLFLCNHGRFYFHLANIALVVPVPCFQENLTEINCISLRTILA